MNLLFVVNRILYVYLNKLRKLLFVTYHNARHDVWFFVFTSFTWVWVYLLIMNFWILVDINS